jgi:hypothetical protein
MAEKGVKGAKKYNAVATSEWSNRETCMVLLAHVDFVFLQRLNGVVVQCELHIGCVPPVHTH